jgi:hypothetical protein
VIGTRASQTSRRVEGRKRGVTGMSTCTSSSTTTHASPTPSCFPI